MNRELNSNLRQAPKDLNNHKLLIIGLTGGIGSGKSAAMAYFQELGVPCIDADIVAREVVEPGQSALTEIADHFGPDLLISGGGLNRGRLREIVFQDPDSKTWLENLLHPLINERIRAWLDARKESYAVLCSPLLLETKQHLLVDRILLIDVPENIQISRTISRDHNTESQVKAIINSQMSRTMKQKKADDVILNDKDLNYLRDQVIRFHQIYSEASETVSE